MGSLVKSTLHLDSVSRETMNSLCDTFEPVSWTGVSRNLDSSVIQFFLMDNVYRTTPKGKAFLEENPGKRFDTWLTRIIAICGAVTGTIALILELLSRFQ